MNVSQLRSRSATWTGIVVVVSLIAALASVLWPSTAHAAARLDVSSELGGTTASANGTTRFDVSGSGYQVIDGGFGGIYVVFGWADQRSWRPSQGGMTGDDYMYVPDSESKNNQGYMGFVAYPGSSTAGEAHDVMEGGRWSLSLNVPGPTFTAQDRSGKNTQVDCREVTCGFFTFGAHGVKNGNNEVFVPVTFENVGGGGGGGNAGGGEAGAGEQAAAGDGGGEAAAGAPAVESARGAAQRPSGQAATGQSRTRTVTQQSSTGGGAAESSSSGGPSAGGAGENNDDNATEGGPTGGGGTTTTGGGSATGDIEVTVDRAAARPGGALAYTAYGFWPGEQATVSLGQGIAAVGPLTAGVDGEVAGVIILPEDIEPGTYELRAVGAGSGLEGAQRFAISDVALTSSSGFSSSVKWEWVFLALAGLLFLAVIGFVVSRRMRGKSDEAGDESQDGPDPDAPEDIQGIHGADDFYGSQPSYHAHSGH